MTLLRLLSIVVAACALTWLRRAAGMEIGDAVTEYLSTVVIAVAITLLLPENAGGAGGG